MKQNKMEVESAFAAAWIAKLRFFQLSTTAKNASEISGYSNECSQIVHLTLVLLIFLQSQCSYYHDILWFRVWK